MPLKAGVVQFCPLYGKVDDNLAELERLILEGASQGAKLLVLPEMAWTGYFWKNSSSILPFCEIAGDGPGQNKMKALAAQLGVHIAFGFPERSGLSLFNSQALISPEGVFRGPYRKTHLFDADYTWAHPGDTGFLVWDTQIGRLGTGICMDLNFVDLIEFHSANETEILLFSTNWLDEGFSILPYWKERLESFVGWSLFANRGGQEFGITFRAQSAIFCGNSLVASIDHRENGVLVYEIPNR